MADKERREGVSDLKPSDAEAPGPITAEHESGSWEQTLAERAKHEPSKPAAKPAAKAKSSS